MLQHLKAAAAIELRKLRTKACAVLLIALPWASDIKALVATNLPALQPYLPENVYKFMGAAVVIAGMVLSLIATHRAVKAANESDNA
jgi:hypothetical protein